MDAIETAVAENNHHITLVARGGFQFFDDVIGGGLVKSGASVSGDVGNNALGVEAILGRGVDRGARLGR